MRIVAVLVCALTILASGQVSADSALFAPYQQVASPDLISTGGTLNYDHTNDLLHFTATPFLISVNDVDYDVDIDNPSSFTLDAQIPQLSVSDLDGKEILSGQLTITGTISALNFTSGTLLTGIVTAFRSRSVDQMEFLFTVMGGDAAGLYGPASGRSGVGIVNVPVIAPSYDQFFASSFNRINLSPDTAGTLAVPEPATFLLGMIGVVGLVAGARIRRKRLLQA